MINVYVIGVFDLFHIGHVELLRRSKELGNKLIVAVNGDELVSMYKRRPYLNEFERLAVVESCKFVDEAFIIRDFDNKNAILERKINIIVHGDDWTGTSYLEQIRVSQEFVDKHGIELIFLPYTEGISTSEIVSRIKNN